jgi:hypothetical protein
VRISFAIGKRVVLSVAGDPFLRDNGSRQPQPETHGQCCEKMQLNTSMRLGAMKKQRDTDVGEMTGYDDEKNGLPPIGRPASEIGHYNNSIYVRAVGFFQSIRLSGYRQSALGLQPLVSGSLRLRPGVSSVSHT